MGQRTSGAEESGQKKNMNKERKTKNSWFRIIIRIAAITALVILSLAVLMNVVYWGGILVVGLIYGLNKVLFGFVWMYAVAGIIVLLFIVGAVKIIKWIIKKTSVPRDKESV